MLRPEDGGGVVRRVAWVVRIAGMIVAVAVAPLAGDTQVDARSFGYVVALVAVPVVGVLEAVGRRRPGPAIDAATLAFDLSLSAWVLVEIEDAAAAVAAGLLLAVGYHAYASGWRFGFAAAAGSLVVLSVPGALGHPVDLPGFSLAIYPFLAASAAVLLALARGERAHVAGVVGRAREKADAILAGVAEAVVVTSPRGRVREWNDAAVRTFDCGEAMAATCGEALGLRRELERLDCSQGCALLRAQLDGLGDADDLRVWRERHDGARQPLLAHVSPLLDADGRVAEVVHSFRDITKLVQAEEAKTMFLATASHELKTPLTVIMGYSELLRRQKNLPPEARDQGLAAIHDRARQLTGIVNRLLMSSRIESGRLEVHEREIDLRPTVEEAVTSVLDGLGYPVIFEAAGDVPPALADPDALRTVLDHLLDNAVKYSAEGQPPTVRYASDDGWVVVEVADRGIGMTRDQVEHCFDRFWQAEVGDVRRFGGTGIGLYIVKSLVDAMGGEVSVSSDPGAGTSFVVRLPAAPDAGAATATDPGALREPSIIREFMRQAGVGTPGSKR